MTRRDYLVFGRPDIQEAERQEVLDCLASRWLGTGPRAARFERDFAAYLGGAPVVAVSSGTAALHLALRLLDLPPGAEVITSAMTFCATANAVIHAGLTPVFADCEPDSLCLDPRDVERRLTPRTRAILPVHFAGRMANMPELAALAQRHRLAVVEDCAHAIETTQGGRHAGTLGDFGCFSFYVTKNLTTVEGGMLVCRDQAQAERARVLSLHGMSKDAWQRFSDKGYAHYEVVEAGYKYNLTDLAASFGIHQLARVEENLAKRAALWAYYLAELAELPLLLPAAAPPGERHALHLFTCQVDPARTPVRRDEVLTGLHAQQIGAGVHYRALHLHQYYAQRFGYRPGTLPVAERIGAHTFSLPLTAGMTLGDAADVVSALRRILEPR